MSPHDHAAMAGRGGFPTYRYPEDAARALGRAVGHVRWRERAEEAPAALRRLRPDEGGGDHRRGARGRRGMARPGGMPALLDCYGIAMPEWRARSPTLPPPATPRRRSEAGSRSRRTGRRSSTRPSSARCGSGSRARPRSSGPRRRWTRRSRRRGRARASSSSRWSSAASSCWSGSSATRSSARWSPAARAGPRPSCSGTSRSGSAR